MFDDLDANVPSTIRVLWVEDEEQMRRMIETTIGRHDHVEIELAPDGRSCLTKAETSAYDLIVLDLRLPDMPGLEVLERLRAKGVHTPALIVTAVIDPAVAFAAGKVGAIGFITKPFDVESIIDVIIANGRVTDPADTFESSTARMRLAVAILRTVQCPQDPKTFHLWARHAGASVSSLKNWCRCCEVPPRKVLQFTRLLRVIHRNAALGDSVIDCLDTSDTRTIHKLLREGGCPPLLNGLLNVSLETYISSQRFLKDARLLRHIAVQIKIQLIHQYV